MTSLSTEKIAEWRKAVDVNQNLEAIMRVNSQLSPLFAFPELNEQTRADVSALFCEQFSQGSSEYQCALLELIRILCREKVGIKQLFSKDCVRNVLGAAGIYPDVIAADFKVVMAAELCVINAVLNSVVVRTSFEAKCERLHSDRIQHTVLYLSGAEAEFPERFVYLNGQSTSEVEDLLYYDLRIAFAASAHSIDLQKKWVGDVEVTNVFYEVLKFATSQLPLDGHRRSEYAHEALRNLFNLYCHVDVYDVDMAQKCANECSRLIQAPLVDDELKQNCVYLLAAMPGCLSPLCPKLSAEEQSILKTTKIYENYDMRFVDAVLDLFTRKVDTTGRGEIETLTTYFMILITLCKNHKAARRYCRLKVIPPLKAEHVEKPPDDGVTLRNKIVRLMMSPTRCKDAAAELLFVLCKRSVNRLIKYTGFGHAAGLLANYGFLGQINDQRRASDSEDSETEDYKKVEEKVDPISGYMRPTTANPFDGMSDEQKEYEAIKLANAMDKLLDEGVFQPASIGPDGKPKPVSHVNELIKDVRSEDTSSSDSD